jgi:hypothetical protein
MKCAIFATGPAPNYQPTTILGTATAPVSLNGLPGLSLVTFTFSPAVSVTQGTIYSVGSIFSVATGFIQGGGGSFWFGGTVTYATFPIATPSGLSSSSGNFTATINITQTANFPFVNEAQQDSTTTFVFDSTTGHADLYGVASIPSTPLNTVAVVSRAYIQKADAGTRSAAVQLKSGATTVASPTVVLTTTGFQWAYRIDTTDPNTGAAWTTAAVNAVNVGPLVVV